MYIASIRHKGLRQLYEDDNAKGVQASSVDKLKKLLIAIETASNLDDLAVFRDGDCIRSKVTWPGSGASRLPETGG